MHYASDNYLMKLTRVTKLEDIRSRSKISLNEQVKHCTFPKNILTINSIRFNIPPMQYL